MKFYEILKIILKEKGLTVASAARLCNIPDSSLRSILSRHSEKVALDIAIKLSQGLDVPLEILNGEYSLIKKKDNDLEFVNSKTLPFNVYPLTDSTVAMIPIVSTVRAGFGGVPEPVYDGTMAVYDRKNPQECVWMKVEGDSMSPNIMDGDYVLVHIQPTAENGDIVVAIWNGEEGTVKKYQRDDNGVMLIPLNTQYPARFITNDQLDEFIIYGVVKETKRILG